MTDHLHRGGGGQPSGLDADYPAPTNCWPKAPLGGGGEGGGSGRGDRGEGSSRGDLAGGGGWGYVPQKFPSGAFAVCGASGA